MKNKTASKKRTSAKKIQKVKSSKGKSTVVGQVIHSQFIETEMITFSDYHGELLFRHHDGTLYKIKGLNIGDKYDNQPDFVVANLFVNFENQYLVQKKESDSK